MGNDGGTAVEALRLDMSAGGDATFSSNIIVSGGQILTPSGTNLALNPNTGIVSVGGVIQCSGTGTSTFVGSVTAPNLTLTNIGASTQSTALVVNTNGYVSKRALGTNAFNSTSFAPLASPALTGNPTAPTQNSSENSTKIATTAYV